MSSHVYPIAQLRETNASELRGGAELQQDKKSTQEWNGREVPFRDILQGTVQVPNEQARAFVNAVAKAKETAQSR